MAEILIDGYNFIHQIPHFKKNLKLGLETAREEFLHELSRLTDYSNDDIVIFFDSNRRQSSEDEVYSQDGFKVIYADKKNDADSYIERAIYDKSNKPYSLRVISSDRKIQDMAIGKNAVVTSPEAFYEELKLLKRTPSEGRC